MEAILDEENVNDNVCEVRSLRMEGIFEKYFWVHVPHGCCDQNPLIKT